MPRVLYITWGLQTAPDEPETRLDTDAGACCVGVRRARYTFSSTRSQAGRDGLGRLQRWAGWLLSCWLLQMPVLMLVAHVQPSSGTASPRKRAALQPNVLARISSRLCPSQRGELLVMARAGLCCWAEVLHSRQDLPVQTQLSKAYMAQAQGRAAGRAGRNSQGEDGPGCHQCKRWSHGRGRESHAAKVRVLRQPQALQLQ